MSKYTILTARSPATIGIALLFLGRVILLLSSPHPLSGDGFGYVAGARHIADTGRLPPLRVQPNGLSLLLSPLIVFGGMNEIEVIVLWIQVAMDAVVVSCLLLCCNMIFGGFHHRWIRLIAMSAILLQPFTATMVNCVYTEQACQVLLFIGSVCFIYFRTRNSNKVSLFLFALPLGLAGLLRSDLLVLNAAIVASVWMIPTCGLQNTASRFKKSMGALCVYSLFPLLFVLMQFASTGEVGFVKPEFYTAGYMAWLRTWFASNAQHEKLAFGPGKPMWKGFEPDGYPQNAFSSLDERQEVLETLSVWRTEGYTGVVDANFAGLATRKTRSYPIRHYLLVPLARMGHFWLNIDGAQTILRVVPIARPFSTIVVGLVLLLRLLILVLGVVGGLSVWHPKALVHRLGDGIIAVSRLSVIAVVLRTIELGVLGTFVWGGLMEVRYVVVVFPFVLLLALVGLYQVSAGVMGRLETENESPAQFTDIS